jgi:hypothetical protein
MEENKSQFMHQLHERIERYKGFGFRAKSQKFQFNRSKCKNAILYNQKYAPSSQPSHLGA